MVSLLCFSSMSLNGCLCRQLPQKKYIFFLGGCPWHADGNRLGCGYLLVRRMCGFYKFFCIPACPWQRADKGARPIQALYRRTARMGIWSIYSGTGRNPSGSRLDTTMGSTGAMIMMKSESSLICCPAIWTTGRISVLRIRGKPRTV